jgi:Bacterial Ig-like domain
MIYRSQVLGGSVTLSTPDFVGGFFDYYPIIGLFDIAGAAPNAARLMTGGATVIPGNEQSTAYLSSDNFQTSMASQVVLWSAYTAGFLWWEPLGYPGVYPNGYASQSQSTVTPFPEVLFTRPIDGGSWPAALPLFVQYNAPVPDSSSTTASLIAVAPAGGSVQLTLSFQGARVIATPQQPLQPGTIYSFNLTSDSSAFINSFTAQ